MHSPAEFFLRDRPALRREKVRGNTWNFARFGVYYMILSICLERSSALCPKRNKL